MCMQYHTELRGSMGACMHGCTLWKLVKYMISETTSGSGTVQPQLSKPRLFEPSIIQTSEPSKSAGRITKIGHDFDMRMCNRK